MEALNERILQEVRWITPEKAGNVQQTFAFDQSIISQYPDLMDFIFQC